MEPYLTTRNGVLFCADCLDVLHSMKSESVDCIFADPPFNLGKDYKSTFNDKKEESDYFNWCQCWIDECARVLKEGGSFFVYGIPKLAIQFAHFMNVNPRLEFRNWIALMMKGTYRRGKRLYPAHYALLYYTRGEPKTFMELRTPIPTCRHCGEELKDYGGHRNKLNPLGLNLTDFWDDTSPNRHKKYKVRQGVNELKIMIPERAILMSTNPSDIVLDPFGGGGTTYQVAEMNDRLWIGVELYDCEYIKKRLIDSFPQSYGLDPVFNYRNLFKSNEDNPRSVL
jgi:site-specific DNA-methyltransferase (adenine-specific)